MYQWRKMNPDMRSRVLGIRKLLRQPWHSPPHRTAAAGIYLVTAACFEHRAIIGASEERMAGFCGELLTLLRDMNADVHAWCVLPNHYHALLRHADVRMLLRALGQLHGRTSHRWNGEEGRRGRKVWFNAVETAMKSDRHFRASLNYVHHNPVHHRLATRWQDWPFGSARDFLATQGIEAVARLWREYPILDYGKDWDPA